MLSCHGQTKKFLTDLHKIQYNLLSKIIIIIISSPLATVELYRGRKMSKSRSPFVDMRVQNNFLVFKNCKKITALFNGLNFLCTKLV